MIGSSRETRGTATASVGTAAPDTAARDTAARDTAARDTAAPSITDVLSLHPVIASIKDEHDLREVLGVNCPVVFVLFGSVITIPAIVATLKDAGRTVFVDVDLVDGFSNKPVVVDFLKKYTRADGVLSSKSIMVKTAKAAGFLAIHRLFLVDSFSYRNVPKQVKLSTADAIE